MGVMELYRAARRLHQWRVPGVPGVLRKAMRFLYGASLPPQAELGEGTQLGYGGMGVVIHPRARIGRHCLISHQVTIGGRSGQEGAPVIGDYVRIGAGAKVLGPVVVGDFAVIGANAVVVKDVASGAVVAGVPARELRREPEPLAAWQRDTGRQRPAAARE